MGMNWSLVETLLRPMVETHPSLVTFYPLQCLIRLIWDQSLWDQSSMLIKAYMGPGNSGHLNLNLASWVTDMVEPEKPEAVVAVMDTEPEPCTPTVEAVTMVGGEV